MLVRADSFNLASQYNIFVFDTLTADNGGINGNAAIGGTSSFIGFDVTGNLLGQGQISLFNSTVGGDVTSGGTVSPGRSTVSGTISQNQSPLPVDFAQAESDFTAASLDWSKLVPNGSYSDAYGTMTITGNDAQMDVIDVSGSDLARINSLVFSGDIPSTATVVVNVSGTDDRMQNFGFSLGNLQAQNIIFNFYEATSVKASSLGFDGSILAPQAQVSFNNGHIDGSLIADSLTFAGQSNSTATDCADPGSNALFAGTVPLATPEPSTMAMLGFGGLLVFLSKLRMKKS